jgi:hypothetical protein
LLAVSVLSQEIDHMDNPAGPRKTEVRNFVAESFEELASHSSDAQSLRSAAMSARNLSTDKTVNVYGDMRWFFFKVKATKPEMYAVRIKAPNLKAAEDRVAQLSEVLSAEHVDESAYHDATFERLAEGIDWLRRQSSVR